MERYWDLGNDGEARESGDPRPGEGVCMDIGVAASGSGGVKPEEHCPGESEY